MSDHDRLWAPWRMAYIKSQPAETPEGAVPGEQPCFLCRCAEESRDRENYVVYRGRECLTVLNRYPYNNGHLLVAPLSHQASLTDVTDSVLLECMQILQRMTGLLGRIMSPDGYNVGLNLGKVAGAGLPGHLHWHIVPRWNGDTNFMPVISDATVLSQSLDELYNCLVQELQSHS